MKAERISNSVPHAQQEPVTQAAGKEPGRKRRLMLAAGAAAVVLAAAALFGPAGKSAAPGVRCLAAAEYPQMAPYPDETAYQGIGGSFDDEGFQAAYDDWSADLFLQRQYRGDAEGAADRFFAASLPQFLAGSGTENRVYSPINVYLALAMLAEQTEGNSRAQLLALLDCPDVETLRKRACALWNANYRDDGAVTSILAASLWLDEDMALRQETLDILARDYYASSYQGQMGSRAMNEALRTWLNDQTGGLLADQMGNIRLDRETILALATTVYFRAKWREEFREGFTSQDIFHGAAGDAVCEFMHQSGDRTYYWADRFGAVCKGLRSGGGMWLLLPDQGVDVDELLTGGQAAEFLLGAADWSQSKRVVVNLSLPKFDVSSQLDLKQGLQVLGVTDVFDGQASDFSPLAEDSQGVFVSQVQHGARVAIDEEGVTAAAYTVMAEAGATLPPDEEVDFVLDRPFLFVITGADGAPLFAGVVKQV